MSLNKIIDFFWIMEAVKRSSVVGPSALSV
jgi:hypothetical protein